MSVQTRFHSITASALSGLALAATVDHLAAQEPSAYSIPASIPVLSERNAFILIAVALLIASFVVPGIVHLARRIMRGRRQFLREIDEGKKQLDLAINNMSQGLVMFDASHRIVFCNQRYIEIYGVSAQIVKPGLPFRDLLQHRKDTGSYFGDVDAYCRRIETELADGKSASLIANSSAGRSILIVNKPLAGGGWVATHEDITERQQLLEGQERAEAVVRGQKLQLDAALRNMSQGLCMFDAEGHIVLFNQRYREMMEEPADYLMGRSLLDLWKHRKAIGKFVGDAEETFANVMKGVREGKTTSKIMERSDGHALRVVDQPMEGGGWVATFEDITEQRRTEQERDRNRELLDLIIDNVPSAIFVKKSTDRRYVLVNRAGEKFWGASRGEMIGKTAADMLPPAEAEKIAAREAELLQAGKPIYDEREILTPYEGVRTINSRRLMISDGSGESQYILGVVDDVTERKVAEERIAHLAHYDTLTGLPNRELFREQLEKELSFVRRGGQLAVLYLDLDHFKHVNDTLGHSVGDELLKGAAGRLRACLRDGDLIARLGGDEFAIVQTALGNPKDAEALAERLRGAILESPFNLNGHQAVIDLSVGIALSPGDGTELDELLKHADLALYGAKSEGRGTYRYFEPEMNARMKRRRSLEVDLRKALSSGELELHYQPLVSLKTDRIVACEALLRWHHPERGMIPPAEFIPVAEEMGLINTIGEWVLRQACSEAATWPSHIKVAVNVSPVQFRNPSLAQTVVHCLAASRLPADRLELEVTESVLMQNNEATLATLHQLRVLGVRISMDDFGTGYSSLSYLRSFPFNKIKIDRSFIADLARGPDAVAIVQAIINLADSLKMATTAEGVETEEQREILRTTGCTETQGYLFSPPRPAMEIAALLRQGETTATRVA